MKAVIFNSGLGNRMGEFTKSRHKAMARLQNGETVFERQLRILGECGIRDIVVTTGPFREQLETAARQSRFSHIRFTFVNNPAYDRTNYIYSMYLARGHFDGDALVLHGDLVFNRKLVKALLADRRGDLALINRSKKLPEKDFKARVEGENIREVSVRIFDKDCFAFQPLYKLTERTLRAWTRRVETFIEAGNDQVYAENALNEIAGALDIRAFSYEGHYADEIDTTDDLARVSREIRPFDFDEQEILFGKGAYRRIPLILKQNRVQRPMLVCDRAYGRLFISEYIDALPVEFVRFSEFDPNPAYGEVAAGVALFRREGCDFILSVGGGSAIDTAKNIKLFSALDPGRNYLEQAFAYSPVRHLAVPTTAGTGSESTRFSVLYYKGEKQSIAHDSILPEYAVLEPRLLETLPLYQKKSTLLDALCQCIEASWSVNADEKCRGYAKKGLRAILRHAGRYLQGDEKSMPAVLKAANYGGRAINIAQTTAAHAMSYKLTSLYGIPHGHAVALCLPRVWKYMLENKRSLQGEALARFEAALRAINEAFGVREDGQALRRFERLFDRMELPPPVLGDPRDIGLLASSVNPVRLGNNPISLDEDVIRGFYESIFQIQ